jgi:phenylpropionate dioxygenase-like ring-hydroxylating dioxygenase large terminal subunit
MGELFRRFWLPALLLEELPAPDCPPVRFKILGENLVAFRDTNDRIAFVQEACPHRKASLYFGRNEECGIRCVYHGWKFDVEGRCLETPTEPADSSFKERISITAYPGAVWGGMIWIYMGPKDHEPPLPHYDWCMQQDNPNLRVWKWMQESNYAQGLEGNIDSAHVPFLHRWFNQELFRVQDTQIDGAPVLTVKETEFGFVYGARRNLPEGRFHWRLTPFVLPVFTTIPSPTGGPGAGFFVLPIDDERSWWWTITSSPRPLDANRDAPYIDLIPGSWRMTRNKDNDYLIDREMQHTVNYTGLPTNRVQDAAMTDSMGPIVDRSDEHLGTSDVAIIFMRKLLLRTAQRLEDGVELELPFRPEQHRVWPLDTVNDEPLLEPVWDAHYAEFRSQFAEAAAPA